MPKTKSRSRQKKPVCALCETSIDDEVHFGKFYVTDEIAVHNFCLLFSSGLGQNGETDDDGIAGFLVEDIKKEVIRGKKLRCSFCRAAGATVGCCKPSCKKVFHLSCGFENKSMHQFFGSFLSYCSNHRPERIVPDMKNVPDKVSCAICYSPVYPKNPENSLWMSCCKNGWFHKACIQKQAMSAGYFFRCPLCNNDDDFQKQMLHHGVYIPQQDASWELEENAYEDLLVYRSQCDAVKCICPKGRKYKKSPWRLVRCGDCGYQGRHARCVNLPARRKWTCEECMEVVKRLNKHKLKKGNVEDHSSQQNAAEYADSEIPTTPGLKLISFPKREASVTDIGIPEKKTSISPGSVHANDSTPKLVLQSPTRYDLRPYKSDNNLCKIVDTPTPTISNKIKMISQNKKLLSLDSKTESLRARPVSQLQTTRDTLSDDVSSSRILQGSDLNGIEDFGTPNPSISQYGIENLPPANESQKQQACLETDKDKKHEQCPDRKKDPVVISRGCIMHEGSEGSSLKSFPLASHNAFNSIHEAANSATPLNGSRKRAIAVGEQPKTVKKQKLNNSSRRTRSSINSKWNKNSYLCIKALFGKPCFCCENNGNNTVSTSPHPKCSQKGSAHKYTIDIMMCGPSNQNTDNKLHEIASDSNSTQCYPLNRKGTVSCEDKNAVTKKKSFPSKSCFPANSSPKYTIDIVRSGTQSSASEGNNELLKKPEIIHLKNFC